MVVKGLSFMEAFRCETRAQFTERALKERGKRVFL